MTKILLRRGLEANIPALDPGEPAYCTDTENVYIGTTAGINKLVNGGGGGEPGGGPDEEALVLAIEAGQTVAVNDIVHVLNGKVRKTAAFSQPFGEADPITATSTSQLFATVLDPLRVVVVYQGSDTKGYAALGTVRENGVTFEAPVLFGGANPTQFPRVAALSAQKIVVTYRDNTGKAAVGNIIGNRIVFGIPFAYMAVDAGQVSITALDESRFAICHNTLSNSLGDTIVGTVNGTTITYGAAARISGTSQVVNMRIVKLDTDKCLIVGTDPLAGGYCRAIVATIAGSTVTYGTLTQVTTDSVQWPSVAVLDPGRAVIGYYSTSSSVGRLRVATITDTTITLGSEVTVNDGNVTTALQVAALGGDRFAVTYSADIVKTAAVRAGTNLLAGAPYRSQASAATDVTTLTYAGSFGAAIVDNDDTTGSLISSSANHFYVRIAATTTINVLRAKNTANLTFTFYNDAGSVIGSPITITANDDTYKNVNYPATKYIDIFGSGTASDIWFSSDGGGTLLSPNMNTTRTVTGTAAGAAVTLSPTVTAYNDSTAASVALVQLGTGRVLAAFADVSDGNAAKAMPYYVADDGTAYPRIDSDYYGFAVKSVGGGSATLKETGYLRDLAGLEPGRLFYWQLDGSLSTRKTNYLAGVAINTTTIKLTMERV